MKRFAAFSVMLAFLALSCAAFAVTPENPKISLKVGDEVYACACGASCPCKSLSKQEGKCTCNKDMVKSKVIKIEGDTAVINVNGKDETFPLKGKFVCGCGASCPCDYVSQSPGKCSCGKDLIKAK
jgi:hypothetical protein